MRVWVADKKPLPYIFGLGVYFVGLNFLAWSYLFRNMAVATALVNVLNIATLTMVSWLMFRDKISLQEGIGICLAVAAVLVLELKM